MRQDEYDDLLAGNAILQSELDRLKAENEVWVHKSDEELDQ